MKITIEIDASDLKRWSKRLGLCVATGVLVYGAYATAAAIGNPAAFVAGDVIKAAEINTAFGSLTTANNELDARLFNLEAKTAALSGTANLTITGNTDLSAGATKLKFYRCNAVINPTVDLQSSDTSKGCSITVAGHEASMACGTGDLMVGGGCVFQGTDSPVGYYGMDANRVAVVPNPIFKCSGSTTFPSRIVVQCLSMN